jgi:hypothetical protein
MGLILSPEVKMRQDGSRAILFSIRPADSLSESAFTFLYPQQAIMLSLFNGQRNLEEIERAISYIFKIDIKSASQQLTSLLSLYVNGGQKISSLIVNSSEIDPKDIRVYDPKEFIVPSKSIDMSDVHVKFHVL